VKDTENMVEQRTTDVRTVGWSLRQKELLGIVLDVIQSLRSSARVLIMNDEISIFCNIIDFVIDNLGTRDTYEG